MVRCNLAVLLAERGMKISKISELTGISRTTLTALSQNHSQGIQFDTMNTLCNFFKVMPNDLITHTPIDIEIRSVEITECSRLKEGNVFVEVCVKENNVQKKCWIDGVIGIDNEAISEMYVQMFLAQESDERDRLANRFLINAIKRLPVAFKADLESTVRGRIVDELRRRFDLSGLVKFDLFWPEEF